ncbi:hypothetical protein GOODEAATRI_033677 [Goodea atripinnis]|uniref:Uncharacterized protein n=1 Tax=Goodea atripinnis TaxID=208336 RepID=A0ABV0MY17_9TELE
MASDLEELIFIPAASHSAANRPSACCRSWLEGASRTASSAKRRDEIHWSPNLIPSGPWLRLEILSIKVVNKLSWSSGQWTTVPPEAEVRLSAGLFSPIPWHRPYHGAFYPPQ